MTAYFFNIVGDKVIVEAVVIVVVVVVVFSFKICPFWLVAISEFGSLFALALLAILTGFFFARFSGFDTLCFRVVSFIFLYFFMHVL